MLASCRHELKNCLWDLRSRTFEEKDMTEAVRRAIGPNAGSAKVDVRFNVPRSDLSETTTHAILRIVRELVINAVRHGQASEIKVAGESHDGTISFSVRDNGCGFNPSNVAGPSTGHFGLQGIRERLNAFGGKLKIESEPGRGTKITAILSTLFSAEK
jgi:signal transduction histidine kinase